MTITQQKTKTKDEKDDKIKKYAPPVITQSPKSLAILTSFKPTCLTDLQQGTRYFFIFTNPVKSLYFSGRFIRREDLFQTFYYTDENEKKRSETGVVAMPFHFVQNAQIYPVKTIIEAFTPIASSVIDIICDYL